MNENNKEIIVHAKQLFWEFMAEFYLPDKPIFFYINLVNRVNQQKKTNEIFKKLCKTHAFLKFFVEILRYIRSNFDPYYFLLFSNEQQINDVKIFKKKYPFAELDFIEHIPFLLSFPLIKNKPIMNFLPDINDINVISFFSDLEEKKIRKDFKNLEISVDFLKEANSFIKNNKNSADINNYVTQCLEKTLKTLLFLPDSLEKIKKCFVVLTEILTFTDFIFKFGETHEDKNILEITMRINELRNNFKKCLKSIFWSNFEETLKNKKKKNKTMHEIFDEKTSESLFSNIFCKLYRDIQNFVKNFQALKLLEWSFLIYLKTFIRFIFFKKVKLSQYEWYTFVKSLYLMINDIKMENQSYDMKGFYEKISKIKRIILMFVNDNAEKEFFTVKQISAIIRLKCKNNLKDPKNFTEDIEKLL